jgi:hypothetical protein
VSTPTTIINQAFQDLKVLAPGGSVSTTVLNDAFVYLNQLISSLSIEGPMAFNQVRQTFNLVAEQPAYTLGSGGSFATTGGKRAVKVTSWRGSYNGVLSSGGAPLSVEDFGAQAKQVLGESTPIPSIVGADTAYPLINIRIHPPPGSTTGTLELGYWTPITQFATVTDVLAFEDGLEEMLHFNLAVILYPQYGRAGGIDPVLAANAQNSKAKIVAMNSAGSTPAPQAAQ